MGFSDNLRKWMRKGDGAPRLAISLSGTMVVALGLVAVACVAWSFYMGFLVGKGQNPEASIQSMTGLALLDDKDKKPAEQGLAPEAESNGESAAPAPLPEGNSTHPHAAGPDERGKNAWPAGPEPTMAASVSTRATDAVRVKPEAKAPVKIRDDGKIYDFNYQAAAYRSQGEAVKLRDSLKKAGIKGNVQKSGKMHLVMVTMRGSNTGAAELRSKLEGLKLGRPLLVSKKPVEAKKNAKGGK